MSILICRICFSKSTNTLSYCCLIFFIMMANKCICIQKRSHEQDKGKIASKKCLPAKNVFLLNLCESLSFVFKFRDCKFCTFFFCLRKLFWIFGISSIAKLYRVFHNFSVSFLTHFWHFFPSLCIYISGKCTVFQEGQKLESPIEIFLIISI